MLKIDLSWQRGEFSLDVVLDIPAGEVVLLSGPSGGGKTTLLRILSGLEKPDQGIIQWEKQIWVDRAQAYYLPTQEREVSLLFQAYALFPHWNVADNLAYAEREKPDADLRQELLEACNLHPLLKHYPSQLSGGQQQRVALARSLLRKSSILLLDEPFAAQDLPGRQKLIQYLQAYQKRYQPLIILSSHDNRGLQQWADQHLYMSDGQLTNTIPNQETKEVVFLGLEVLEGRPFARLQIKDQEFWYPDPPAEWSDLGLGTKVLI